MNGSFMPWFMGDTDERIAAFRAAFQHIAEVTNSVAGVDVRIVWNPNVMNWTAGNVADTYPGDEYVDVVGVDIYSPLYPRDLYDVSTGKVAGSFAEWVAEGRDGARQVLALQPAAPHRAQGPGPHRQGAMADRARLPGAQAGDRARALRGPRLARLPPPRQPLHRSLRLPGGRALPFSPCAPLHPPAARGTCATRRLPAARRRRSGLKGTCQTRSAPSAGTSSSASPEPCRAAHAASSHTSHSQGK